MNDRLPRNDTMKPMARRASGKASRGASPDGRVRAVIDKVIPEIDCGRFAVKRIVGDTMVVEADVFTDGHDTIAVMLGFRHGSDPDWTEVPMTALVNDRW